ncbi:MAG: hypoxanthine phosphoribosyltransferase [Phycisphaerae bacterium]|jgi:hypoxanthine phosphoribosyltransferase|nr:hypoxanthine phosphoribosyltransferase [Phycisphaerae bacterium]
MTSRPHSVHDDVTKVLITSEAIQRRVREIAETVSRDYEADGGARLVIVPVLTGAFMFLADLVRDLPHKIRIEVVTVSSYPGDSTVSKGAALVGVLPKDLEGRDVLIVDDILDSGQTLGLLQDEILKRHPRSVRTCVFLRKECRRVREVTCDYVGFEIPDAFVVGYGLDYDGFYRNLPYVGVLGVLDGGAA